jgi:hypothetical protein
VERREIVEKLCTRKTLLEEPIVWHEHDIEVSHSTVIRDSHALGGVI